MSDVLLIGFVIFLVILVVLAILGAVYYRDKVTTCQTTQSAYCFAYLCPASAGTDPQCGSQAFRCLGGTINADGTCNGGTKICST